MHPVIIQGGMGVGISGWKLAKAVASRGHLGVVSGTVLDTTLVRRLNDGDPGGHYRRALDAYPLRKIAAKVLGKYFRPKGREGAPYSTQKLYGLALDRAREHILALSSFAEVFLAREGHDGPVGLNLLTKVQPPTLPSLYGAMLAGVAYVLMGAGIPREIPGSLDLMSEHHAATIRVDVQGAASDRKEALSFTPRDLWEGQEPTPATRPAFIPIVASNSLATMMARKSTGRIDGFIVEGPSAGGHNAPPRGARTTNARGEPLYGDRDVVDLPKLNKLGLPFWVAGSAGTPERLAEARAAGAAGIQVGTLFAYCEESGLRADLKAHVIRQMLDGTADVFVDDRASPTGFPFRVVSLAGTLSEPEDYAQRKRVCDLGYLRIPYLRDDDTVGFRCAAEPVDAYVKKGGTREDTVGRKCLCNALTADIGVAQERPGSIGQEPPLLTSGDDVKRLGAFLQGRTHYTAGDVLDYLLGDASESSDTASA